MNTPMPARQTPEKSIDEQRITEKNKIRNFFINSVPFVSILYYLFYQIIALMDKNNLSYCCKFGVKTTGKRHV